MNTKYKKYTIVSFAALLVILAGGAFLAYKVPESLYYIFIYSSLTSQVAGAFIVGNPKEKPRNSGARFLLVSAVLIVYVFVLFWFLWNYPLLEINNLNTGVSIVVVFGVLAYVVGALISLSWVYIDKIVERLSPNVG